MRQVKDWLERVINQSLTKAAPAKILDNLLINCKHGPG
jgi:hypothetical protein